MTNNFIKGLATGVAAGIVITSLVNPMDAGDVKRLNKNANRAFSTIGGVLDGMMGAWR